MSSRNKSKQAAKQPGKRQASKKQTPASKSKSKSKHEQANTNESKQTKAKAKPETEAKAIKKASKPATSKQAQTIRCKQNRKQKQAKASKE